jgi:hypothetical protein
MAVSYHAAIQAIQDWRGQTAGVDATYPGSVYDQGELDALRRPPFVVRDVPVTCGTRALAIAEDIEPGTLGTLRRHMALYVGPFDLIVSDPYLARHLAQTWRTSNISGSRAVFNWANRAAQLSPAARACAATFAHGVLQPFVAGDTSLAVQVARWAPGGSHVQIHGLFPSSTANMQTSPFRHVLPGKLGRDCIGTIPRTGNVDVDAFIAARERALHGDVYDIAFPKARTALTFEIM